MVTIRIHSKIRVTLYRHTCEKSTRMHSQVLWLQEMFSYGGLSSEVSLKNVKIKKIPGMTGYFYDRNADRLFSGDYCFEIKHPLFTTLPRHATS